MQNKIALFYNRWKESKKKVSKKKAAAMARIEAIEHFIKRGPRQIERRLSFNTLYRRKTTDTDYSNYVMARY